MSVNARWEALTGLSFARACGDGWLHAFHPDDRASAIEAFQRAIDTRGSFRGTYRVKLRDGRVRWLTTQCVPVHDARGVTGFLGTVDDVTEQRDAELLVATQADQLRLQAQELARARDDAMAALRARSQFVANMSHELRTPLHAILGMTALALDSPIDDECREYIESARESATTLIAVMDDVLDLSRIEAERCELSPSPIDVGALVGDTLKSLAPRAHERGLELILECRSLLPRRVLGDPVRLKQVLTNLVSNAVKFTERGEVIVSVSHEITGSGVELHIDVCDTGIGIPPEEQEQIFEPFVQVDGSSSRCHGGVGLGLAIASRLARLMSGHLWVESTVGTGSTFHASLPLSLAEGGAVHDPAPGVARVLLVDDHAGARDAFVSHARLLGLDGTAVATGAEGLAEMRTAAARHRPFDVVFVDYSLGTDDAHAVARAMDEDGRLRHVPRILVTTAGSRAHASARERAGFSRSVLKPLVADDIRLVLQRLHDASPSAGERRASRIAAMQAPMWHPTRAGSATDVVERHVVTTPVSTFDPQGVWEALSNDPELVAARLAVFLVRWQRLVRQVHVALAAVDVDAIEHCAHAMRSSLHTMSAIALTVTATELESAARDGDVDRIRHLVTRLDAEAPLLVRDIRHVIDQISE